VALARARQAQGDAEGAFEELRKADRIANNPHIGNRWKVRVEAWQARLHVARGDLRAASRWAQAREFGTENEFVYSPESELEHTTLARLLIAQHRADALRRNLPEVLRLLERMLAAAETQGRQGSANEILFLQALAYQAQGNLDLAMVPFTRSLTQTEPAGPVRLFLDEGPPVARLLNEAAQRGFATPYVHSLRSAFASAHHAPLPAQPKREALSERELQVLRLLATDLSGPQIARELFVSLNTFRTHTKHIFAKLSVNSRPAAARRAHPDPLGRDYARHALRLRPRRLGDAGRGGVEKRVHRSPGEAKTGGRDEQRHPDRDERVGLREAEGRRSEGREHQDGVDEIGREVEGVGRERLAPRLPRHPRQRAPAPGVHGDRGEENADRSPARLDLRVARREPAQTLEGDRARQEEEQRRLEKGGERLDFPVAVMVLGVRRLARDPDREPGHTGRGHVEKAVGRVRLRAYSLNERPGARMEAAPVAITVRAP